MFCPKCGAKLRDGAVFCSKCGNRLAAGDMEAAARVPAPRKNKSKGLLVILLLSVVFLLMAAVGGGIFYYLNEKKSDALLESVQTAFRGGREMGEEETEEESPEERRQAEETLDTEGAAILETMEATAASMVPTAAAMPVNMPATASVQYSTQTSFSGLVRAGVLKSTAFDSSHVVQANTAIDNSGWSAFDGQSTTSWQEGAVGDGYGQYVGISFDREYQVKIITFLLGNHRSDTWYVRNNTPKTLTINLSGEVFQASFPKEKTEFALVLSRPVAAVDITITVDDIYKGTEYEDAVIAEVGVYGN